MRRVFLKAFIILFVISCVPTVREIYIIERLPEETVLELPTSQKEEFNEIWKLIEQGKARKAYLRLKKMDQNSFFTSVSTGYSYLLMDNLEQAELWFKKAISIKNENSSPHVGLAQVLEKKGDSKGAFSEWRIASNLNPQNVNVKLRFERVKANNTEKLLKKADEYLLKGDMENGINTLEEVLFYSPELIQIRLRLIELYEKIGKGHECISHLEIVSRAQPSNLSVKKKLGELYLKNENYERALDIFQELSQFDPKDKEIKELLSRAENAVLSMKIPDTWKELPNKRAITRGDLAGLISVKFQKFFIDFYIKPPIIIDISNHWAKNFIFQVTSLEIMDVYPNHAFYPENLVSRQDLAVAIYRLADVLERFGKKIFNKLGYKKPEIKDIPVEHALRGVIEKVVGHGIMELKETGYFRPGDPVSGKEGLAIISFLFELAEKN